MTKSAGLVALSAVGAAVVVAWLAFGSHEVTPPSPPETRTATPDVPATETTVGVPSVTAVEVNASPQQASSTATDDERAASEAKKISDAFERGVTSTFVDYLVSKGASREDSERVVADSMREVASCVQHAVPTRPPDDPARAELVLGNSPVRVSGLFSSEGIGACMESVQQRIGLPPKVLYGLNLRESTIEFTATVLPE